MYISTYTYLDVKNIVPVQLIPPRFRNVKGRLNLFQVYLTLFRNFVKYFFSQLWPLLKFEMLNIFEVLYVIAKLSSTFMQFVVNDILPPPLAFEN